MKRRTGRVDGHIANQRATNHTPEDYRRDVTDYQAHQPPPAGDVYRLFAAAHRLCDLPGGCLWRNNPVRSFGVGQQRRIHEARLHRGHGYAIAVQPVAQRFQVDAQRPFAGVVAREGAPSPVACDGGDTHDLARLGTFVKRAPPGLIQAMAPSTFTAIMSASLAKLYSFRAIGGWMPAT